jgi:hypothetical protein
LRNLSGELTHNRKQFWNHCQQFWNPAVVFDHKNMILITFQTIRYCLGKSKPRPEQHYWTIHLSYCHELHNQFIIIHRILEGNESNNLFKLLKVFNNFHLNYFFIKKRSILQYEIIETILRVSASSSYIVSEYWSSSSSPKSYSFLLHFLLVE